MSGYTPGPWEWRTSNSMRRLSAGGKDGAVLHAYIASDGVPCLHVREEDMPVIAAAPELAEALKWYAEQAEGCRKIGSIGEPARNALDKDGGQRARAALLAAGVE